MPSATNEVERLDLLNCDVALDPDGTEAANADLTMTFKVRQHGLGAPAVVALESCGVDLIQLFAWVLADIVQDRTFCKVQAQP